MHRHFSTRSYPHEPVNVSLLHTSEDHQDSCQHTHYRQPHLVDTGPNEQRAGSELGLSWSFTGSAFRSPDTPALQSAQAALESLEFQSVLPD